MQFHRSILALVQFVMFGLCLPLAAVVAAPQAKLREPGVVATPVVAQKVLAPPADPSTAAINHLITKIVLDSVPQEYTDTKDWGKTTKRWDGVRLRREGWKLETKRAWSTVNHGLWQKYSVQLIDPERQFSVELANVRAVSEEVIAFDLMFVAPLAVEARQAQWVNGVQLYSVSADAEAQIRLTISCQLSSALDGRKLPPDVVFRPAATAAGLHVEHFVVKRVSKIGGEFAEQITQLVETQLDDFVAAEEPKIVEKINRQIEKRADEFRISLGDAARSTWAEKLWPNLK